MRTVVILLLLANLTFFGYTRLDATSEGEAIRLGAAGAAGKDQAADAAAGRCPRPCQGRCARRRLRRMGAVHRRRPHAGARGPRAARAGQAAHAAARRSHDGVLGVPAAAGEPGRCRPACRASSRRAASGDVVGRRQRRPALHGVTRRRSTPRRRRGRGWKTWRPRASRTPGWDRASRSSTQTVLVIRDPQAPVVARIRDLRRRVSGQRREGRQLRHAPDWTRAQGNACDP